MKYLRPTRHKRRLAIALLLAGLVLCIWQSARLAHEQALNNLRDDARNELRLSAANLRGYLLRYDYLPQMLASRETVKRFLTAPEKHDAMPLNLQLDRFRFTAGVSDVYLLDHDGTTVAASNWHRDDTFIGESYAFRPYYKQAIAGGEGRFYGLGTQSLARGYYFSAPVWLDHTAPDARPEGVVVVKVLLGDVEQGWSAQNAEFLVTDRDNIVFMASRPGLRLNALQPLSDDKRQALKATRRYADEPLDPSGIHIEQSDGNNSRIVSFDRAPLDDGRYLSLRRPLPEFGWTMHILKPLKPVIQAQWLAALLAGGLYGVVALAGGIAWQRLRLRREREAFAERERRTLARVRDELEDSVERRTQDLVASNRQLSAEIDERRRAEANLRQTQDELIQAAKLAVLGQLAAGINHELNQPLAAIRAYGENARRFIDLARLEQADANLEQIIELTHRMTEISAQLRQFSRKSSEHHEHLTVQSCLAYALRLFQSRLNDGHTRLEQHLPETPVWVYGDLVRLEQVIVNLISNALQAVQETPAPALDISLTARDGYARLCIADNGRGIDDAHMAQVFEPLFTTRAPGAGLGLGLSISARIMEDLDGRLDAANRPEGGACFTLTLPLSTAPDTLTETPPHA